MPNFSNKNTLKSVKINSKSLIETYNNQISKISKQTKLDYKSKKKEKENIDINQRTTKKRSKIIKIKNQAKSDNIDSLITKPSSETTKYMNSKENFPEKDKSKQINVKTSEKITEQEIIRKNYTKSSYKNSRKSSASSFSISKATSTSWHSSLLESDGGKDENLNNTKVTNYSTLENIERSALLSNTNISKSKKFDLNTNESQITAKLPKTNAVTSSTNFNIESKLKRFTSFDNGEVDLNKVKELYDFKYGINASATNQPYKRITSGFFRLPFENDLDLNKSVIKNEENSEKTAIPNDQESLESKSQKIIENKYLLNWIQNYNYQRRKLNRHMNKVRLRKEAIQNENLQRWSESILKKNSATIARPISSNKQLLQLDSGSKISFQHQGPCLIEPRNTKSAFSFRPEESLKELHQSSNTKRPKSVTFAFNCSNLDKNSNTEDNNNNNIIKPIIHLQSGYLISQIEMEDILREVEERINAKKSNNEIIRNINLHSNLSYNDICEITDSDSDENETNNCKKNPKSSAKTMSKSSSIRKIRSLKLNENKDFINDDNISPKSHRLSFRPSNQTKILDSTQTKRSNVFSRSSQHSEDDVDEYYYYFDTNRSDQTRNKKSVPLRTPASIPCTTLISLDHNNNNNNNDNYSQLNIEYRLPNSIERYLLPVRFPILYRNILKNLYRLKSGNQFNNNNNNNNNNNGSIIKQFARVNAKSFANKVN